MPTGKKSSVRSTRSASSSLRDPTDPELREGAVAGRPRAARPLPLVVVVLGLALVAGPETRSVSAQAPSSSAPAVEASVRGTTIRDAKGGPVVFPLLLRNASGHAVEARIQLELPSTWNAPGSAGSIRLESGGTRVHLLGLGVPASARAGEHAVPWSVEVAGELVAGDTLAVRVPRRPALALEAGERPQFVVAGTARPIRFHLTNEGNTSLQVRLETRWTGGEAPEPDPADVRLDPGEAVPVRVLLRTEAASDGGRIRQHVLEVLARAQGTELDPERASVPLEVVRAADGSGGPMWHSLPVEASVWGAPTGSGNVWGQVRGEGPVRAGGTTHLRFLLRGPEPRGTGLVGRDRYRVGLEGEAFRLTAGDQLMRRTMLTEPGREAFGGSGEVELGPLAAGGFHGENRRGNIDYATSGGFVGLQAGRGASATLSRVVRTGWSPADLWSLSARLRPSRILDLSAEVGRGASDPDPASARRLEASGAWSGGRYVVRHLRVDSLYPSAYRGRREDQALLGLQPVARLRLEGSIRRDVDGRARGGMLTGGRSTRVQARAGMAWGRAFGFDVRRTREEVRFGHSTLRSRSWSGRLHMTMSAGPIRFGPVVEYGLLRGDELERPHPILDTRLEVSTPVGDEGSLSASVAYESGDPRPGLAARERFQGRLDGRFELGSAVQLRFLARGSRVASPTPWTHGLLDVGATVALPHGQELQVRARTTRTFGGSLAGRNSVSLGYTIPLDVPLGRAGTVGRVGGRVVDPERGGGVDSVLVRMGRSAAVTDSEGRFVFPAVEPGRHRIRLDAGTLPQRSIVVGSDFRDVEARGAEDHEVEFELGRGGRIEGRIERFETGPSLAMVDAEDGDEEENLRSVGPVPRALVVLEGPNGARRRLTDGDGTFSVAGLDPGRWQVRVAPGGLPPRHRVTPDPAVVELEPAGRASVAIRVVPVSRTVRLVSEETVIVEGESDRWYTVRPNDPSLMEIARRVYDDGSLWPRIWTANRERLPDPDVIEPGQRLRIPEKAPLTAEEKRMRARYFEEEGGGGG